LRIDYAPNLVDVACIMSLRLLVPLVVGALCLPLSLSSAQDLAPIKEEAALQAAKGGNPAEITQAAIDKATAAGLNSTSYLEIASVVMAATPTIDPIDLAGIAAVGIKNLDDAAQPMALAALWSQAAAKHGKAQGDDDAFMEAFAAALAALGVPQSVIDAAIELMKQRFGGQGFNNSPVGGNLGGGSGLGNPILTGPQFPIIGPTPTPEPPVTPVQNQ